MLPCFQAEPPAIMVATVASLCQMVEKRAFSLGSIKILVIDEVDHFSVLQLQTKFTYAVSTHLLGFHACKDIS